MVRRMFILLGLIGSMCLLLALVPGGALPTAAQSQSVSISAPIPADPSHARATATMPAPLSSNVPITQWPQLPGIHIAATMGQPGQKMLLAGWFTVNWGDGKPGSNIAVEIYMLTDDKGQSTQLLLNEELARPLGGILALNRKRVIVEGYWVHTPTQGEESAVLHVQSIRLDSQAKAPTDQLAIPSVSGPQPWISIMCKFADVANEPKPLSYFQGMYSDAYPGLDHYWRELSYNTINFAGSGAVGWYTLPQPRAYYVYDMNGDGEVELDRGRAANDCTAVADRDVYFPNYVGINLMFNYDLDLYAWGGSRYMTLDGLSKVWYMTWEPPWGYQNIGVIYHETGHGFGLPHSSGAYGQTYDNQWDVMSDHWSGCYRDGQDHSDPVYGCLGQHTISYHKDILGWITVGRKYTATLGSQATITLEQLALPQTNNYLMARIPIRGSATHFYTVEARRLVGYDSHNPLPGQAVIIHEVDTTRVRPAYVVDVDNNGNTGDAGAMWIPDEAFIDETNGITISVDLTTTTGFIVTIESQALQLSNVDISGPTSGIVQARYTFTATTSPITATQPITYVWQATGQSPLTHTGGLNDTAAFTWNTPGTKTITVAAANAGGMVTDTHIVTVYIPPAGVDISGPASGIVQASYTFTATTSPITATQPITYVWQVTGQSLLTHTGGLSDTVAYTWKTPGTQTITVTTTNAGGRATSTHIVTVYTKFYLPLIMRRH